MADSNVNIRINAQNTASPVIKQVNSDLSKMDKAAGTAAGGIGALAKVAGAAGLVAFGVQAANAAVELANLGNQSIAMRASFEQMAGGADNARTILEALTEASRGTVTQYDLMLASNRAMLLGVADSAEEFSQLMQIAAARGRAMGLSTTQAFNDIVTGLGRMSPLILDNLGIVVDQEKAQAAYAVTLGKTAAELTDAEKKQALVNDVIANSADLLRDANANAKVYAGEGAAQLTTAWAEFRTALGESLGPLFDARAKDVANGVQLIIDSINNRGVTAAKSALENVLLEAQKRADLNNLPLQDPNANLRFDPYPGQPIPPPPVDVYDDQVQRIKLVQFALEEVQKAQAANLPGAELWADQIQRVTDRVIQFGEVSDTSLGSVARLLADISNTQVDQKLQDAIDRAKELGALSDATRPDVSADVALGDMQRQIRDMLDLVKAANASLGYATQTGNTAAADVANGYLNNLIPAIRVLIGQYNDLAEAQGKQRIVGVSYGNADIIYQTVDALEAEKKAAEDVATALTIIGESDGKLQGLYDTLLDSGNIDGAAASFEAIRGVIQSITEQWVSQGKTVEEIQGTLLPKLIAEIDTLIGEQIAAGNAGITAGELIGTGFLSSLPGIQTIIDAVAVLTGNVIAAGESIRAVQRQAGVSLSQFAPGRGTVGAGGALAGGVPATLGRAPAVDRSFGGLGGELSRREAGIGGRGIVGGVGASFGGGGGGGGSIDNEAQKLANRLTSILNGALKSGINLDEILGRQDAIEEPARRLADIAVRGFESPWVQYFKDQFPEIWSQIESSGDPKRAAASILKDFEDGLRPELLDKNRAKELVRRALLGESNISTLASEIAAELATEMGVSLEQAQQAAAGILGTGGVGTDSATGMDGGTAATAFTDSFIGVMSGMLERFKGAGQSAGSQWGVGFMATVEAGVPGQLIGLLVSLVTPAVMANLAANGSRTGAS